MKLLAPSKTSCKTSAGLADQPAFEDNESGLCNESQVAAQLQRILALIERRWRQRIESPTFDGSMEQHLLRRAHLALGELWEYLEREDAA